MLAWWFDVRKICMVPGDCDVYCPLCCCWWWWFFIPIFDLFWERKNRQINFVVITKPELLLINMCSPTFVSNLMTLAWKISPGMPKPPGSLNGPICAYLMRQNPIMELIRDLRTINVFATFKNDPRKTEDLRALTVTFNVLSWKTCRNLVTLAWKMSTPRNTKRAQPIKWSIIRMFNEIELL